MSRIVFKLLPLIALASVIFGVARTAHAEGERKAVDLYTIGPSSELPSRFGHSLLCVRPAERDTVESGRCYDYGVADREDIVHVVWTALRGVPSFVPVVIDEPRAISFFKGQGRQIERQRLSLSDEQSAKLVAALDEEVRDRRAYAYHAYRANCATKLRDHIDAASGGRLRPGPSHVPVEAFRETMEEGHSGRIGILTLMAIYLGEPSDRVPTPWEAMLLPSVLRDGVAERFSAPPEKIAESLSIVLPTSRAIGRFAVVVLAFVLLLIVRLTARWNRLGIGVMIAGGVLGLLALSIELAAVLATWPEISRNWALLVFLPTDLAIPYLYKHGEKRLTTYLKIRMAMAGGLVALEIATVIHQPILPLAALVVLPMAAILSSVRDRLTRLEQAPTSSLRAVPNAP